MSPKLTPAQARVMEWLAWGWVAEAGVGSAVIVNGSRICNVDTMQSLYRAGFATRDELGCWRATPSGLALRDRLNQPT
ncbi:hypothetical protein D7S81_25015 [Ralstonia insidiosa]|nr:hypothetical protein [Ralstonia insidiosa]MBA9939869.1 hypothetical protein [Ralstonia insidiosa]